MNKIQKTYPAPAVLTLTAPMGYFLTLTAPMGYFCNLLIINRIEKYLR